MIRATNIARHDTRIILLGYRDTIHIRWAMKHSSWLKRTWLLRHSHRTYLQQFSKSRYQEMWWIAQKAVPIVRPAQGKPSTSPLKWQLQELVVLTSWTLPSSCFRVLILELNQSVSGLRRQPRMLSFWWEPSKILYFVAVEVEVIYINMLTNK